MSADVQDIIAKIMLQRATNPTGPNLFGLQAQPDTNAIGNVLSQLKDQQYLAGVGNTPGQFGYLHDAGQKAFASVGQQLGNGLNAVLQPPPPPDQNRANQLAAIQEGNQSNNAALAAGTNPQQAKIDALQRAAARGLPGAAAALDAEYEKQQKTVLAQKQGNKDDAQAADALDNVKHRAIGDDRAIKQNTWQNIGGNAEYVRQVNGLGEQRSVKIGDKSAIPMSPEQSAAMDKAAEDVANYKIPESQVYGRGMTADQKALFHAQVVSKNSDYDLKNYKQSTDAIKAYGPQGTLGQQVLKTQNAMNHLSALQQYNDALAHGVDPKLANSALNNLAVQLGLPEGSAVQAVAPIVASEVASSLVKGGGGVEERAEKAKELNAQLNLAPAQATVNINAMRSLLGAQYKNAGRLYEKTTRRKDFEDMFPIEGGFPAPPGTSSPKAPAKGASGGWGAATVATQ